MLSVAKGENISETNKDFFSNTNTATAQRYKPDVSSIRLLQRFFLEHFNTSDALDLVFLFTLVF